MIALTADSFGGACPWPGSSVPTRWVGLAGIYHLDSVAPVKELLLGGDRQADPAAWEAVDRAPTSTAPSGSRPFSDLIVPEGDVGSRAPVGAICP